MKKSMLFNSTLSFAVGVGLFVFSQQLERSNPESAMAELQGMLAEFQAANSPVSSRDRDDEMTSSEIIDELSSGSLTVPITRGVGAGLIALGILGWASTLLNAYKVASSQGNTGALIQMNEHTARSISIVGIWFAVAIIMTFSLYRTNWPHSFATTANALVFVIVLGGISTIATAMLCGWRPWNASMHAIAIESKI